MQKKDSTAVIIASNNQHKIEEIKAILSGFFSEFYSLKDKGIEIEVEETEQSFFGNAMLKAKAVAELTGSAALADDSGLMVDALGGAPGVYSARYAGNQHSDADNNALLLANLAGKQNRAARFVTEVVLYRPDGSYVSASGSTDGIILEKARGDNGFGYDPLFYSSDLCKTFAEASAEEKNSVSHRGRALSALKEKLS